MTQRSAFRCPPAVLLAGVGLLCAGVGLAGCKSRPRGGVYIVHNQKPRQPDPHEVAQRELAELVLQPQIRDLRYQSFVRKLLARSGCDSGACHGTNRGGGLSFEQGSPHNRRDYDEVLKRLDRKHPEKSELVEKMLNKVPHNGGRGIDEQSCDYQRLIAWIGEQPEPTCTDPVPTEDAVRFAREVAPALVAMGCADKVCHGGGPARARFDLEGLVTAPSDPAVPAAPAASTAPLDPKAVAKAHLEFKRFNTGRRSPWLMEIIDAANAADGVHQQKVDPLSCAYRRIYSYIGKAPEQTCDLSPPKAVKPPSLEAFTATIIPDLGRRGCLQIACHGGNAGGMTLMQANPGSPEALHVYLMLLGRVEDLDHIDDSTLLRTARNKEPHGGGPRLGGKGDCVDDHITAWLHGQPIKPCKPPVPPTYESFVAQVQPVLEKMTCTNPKCHGSPMNRFVLAYKATLPGQLMQNYKAILREIDYDYTPFSGVMQRMREPCAYAVTGAWIEKKPRPKCTLVDPDPSIFPRRDDQGNVMHPKVEPGPPTPYKP